VLVLKLRQSQISSARVKKDIPGTDGSSQGNHLSMSAFQAALGSGISLVEQAGCYDRLGDRRFAPDQVVHMAPLVSRIAVSDGLDALLCIVRRFAVHRGQRLLALSVNETTIPGSQSHPPFWMVNGRGSTTAEMPQIQRKASTSHRQVGAMAFL
jgi:hypothetical protein